MQAQIASVIPVQDENVNPNTDYRVNGLILDGNGNPIGEFLANVPRNQTMPVGTIVTVTIS